MLAAFFSSSHSKLNSAMTTKFYGTQTCTHYQEWKPCPFPSPYRDEASALRAPLPVPRKISRQRLPRIRLLHPRHLLRRALRHDAAAFFAAFGAKVDDPVGVADHVQMVFDDDDRIAQVGQTEQHVEQLLHVVEVQAGGGLIEKVKSFAGLALAQLAGQLDALRLAARQGDSRLTEMNVAEAHIDQGLQFLFYLRNVFENGQRVGDRHLQQIGNGVAIVFYGQRFMIVAPSAANLAEH